MPSKLPMVVALRADQSYCRYLKRLANAIEAAGVRGLDTPHALAEHALAVLGSQYGLKAPPRTRPVGTNQHGLPKGVA